MGAITDFMREMDAIMANHERNSPNLQKRIGLSPEKVRELCKNVHVFTSAMQHQRSLKRPSEKLKTLPINEIAAFFVKCKSFKQTREEYGCSRRALENILAIKNLKCVIERAPPASTEEQKKWVAHSTKHCSIKAACLEFGVTKNQVRNARKRFGAVPVIELIKNKRDDLK